MSNEVNVDLTKYAEGKEAGTASVIKIDGAAHLRIRKYDPNTGKPVPLLLPVDGDGLVKAIEEKEKQKTAVQLDIDTLNTILSDISSAEELVK